MAAPAVVPITREKQSVLANCETAAKERARQLDYKRSIDQRAGHIDQLEAKAAAITQQIRALNEEKQAALAEIESSENALLAEMKQLKASKLIGMERTLSMRPNPPRLIVEDESKIPAEYMREETIIGPNKIAIKAALAAGEEIDGCKLEQGVSLLRR